MRWRDLLAVAGVAAVAAAGCGGASGAASPPERTSGFLGSVDRSGAVGLDFAELLSGEEAVAAARRVGAIGPDEALDADFFVLDEDDAVRELRVTDRTKVRLYDCTGPCVLRDVAATDFLTGAAPAYGGDKALYALELDGVEITSLVEQYLP